MKFKLSKYIIPTVIAMVIVGTYTNIDGLFIGNVCGDNGLAAINIAWPIVAFICAVGTGLAVGGSVIISSLRGVGFEGKAERAKFTTLVLLFAAGIVTTVFCLITFRPLLKLMGAEDIVLKYASEYSLVVSAGAVFQIAGAGIVVLLRNDGKTIHSMVYTFIGLVIHILLDLLLVGKYKLYGIAFSTVISQAVVMILGLMTVKVKKSSLYKVKKILVTSTAPVGINFVPSLTLLFTNFFAMRAGGTAAVSAYAVMSYAVYTFDYIFQGVCDGIQPVLSYTSWNHYEEERKRAVKTGVITLVCLASVMMLSTPLVERFLPGLFAVSDDAGRMMHTGLVIYSFSYLFKAMLKWIIAYSYSLDDIITANILTYAEPLVLSPLCLAVLPVFFGINGIWLSLTVSQITATLIGAVLLFISGRKKKKSLSAGGEVPSAQTELADMEII